MNTIDEDLKNNSFHNLYLIYGEEAYLRNSYKNRLIKALGVEGDTMNFNTFTGDETRIETVIDICETLPFFTEKRVVLVENSGLFQKANDKLTEYLESIPGSTVLIFSEESADKRLKSFKAADKAGVVSEMKTPDERTLQIWVSKKLKDVNKLMKQDAWQEFLARTDLDMQKMDNELSKLIGYTWEREEITLSDIEAVCSVHTESKIFDMISGIASGNKSLVIGQYHNLLEEKEPPARILSLIIKQFRRMLAIKSMNDNRIDIKTISLKIKAPEFGVRKDLSLSKNFTMDMMRNLINDGAELEYGFKTGTVDEQMAVELLIMKYI